MRLSVAAILTALTVLWRKVRALRTFLILGAEPIARAGDARDRREREPVFGRITRFRITRGNLEPYLGLVRERVLPEIRALDGFTGYFALIDDARGEVVVLTLWASEHQMHGSETAVARLRGEASEKVGATVVSVERLRVAISEFD